MPRRRSALTALALALLALPACNSLGNELRVLALRQGAAPALERYRASARERGAPNVEALAALALGLLERSAGSSDPRERSAGLAGLRSIGQRGREVLRTLATRPGVAGDRAAAVLWEVMGGEIPVERRLADAARSDDPERREAGLAWFEATGEYTGLLAALESVHPTVRRAAAMRLRRRSGTLSVSEALVVHALHDDNESVRAACVSALGAYGEAAAPALEQALSDPEHVVRMTAMGALARAAPERARAALGAVLGGSVVSESLEAARVLAPGDPRAVRRILGALEAASGQERAQAAVAASSLVESNADALGPFIEDADPEVRLRIGALLVRRPALRDRVLRALRPATRHLDPLVAVRALAVLAEAQDASAAPGLRGALAAPDSNIRRIAVLAWSNLVGGTGDAEPLAPLLLDSDRSTRLIAAAELVRIAGR